MKIYRKLTLDEIIAAKEHLIKLYCDDRQCQEEHYDEEARKQFGEDLIYYTKNVPHIPDVIQEIAAILATKHNIYPSSTIPYVTKLTKLNDIESRMNEGEIFYTDEEDFN